MQNSSLLMKWATVMMGWPGLGLIGAAGMIEGRRWWLGHVTRNGKQW